MQKGILTKISENKNALRTSSVEGVFDKLPREGDNFTIYGEPLTEGASVRVVTTSPIVKTEIMHTGNIVFKTMNSSYELEFEDA